MYANSTLRMRDNGNDRARVAEAAAKVKEEAAKVRRFDMEVAKQVETRVTRVPLIASTCPGIDRTRIASSMHY